MACRSSSSNSANTTREESFHSIAIVTLGLGKEGLKMLGMLSCLRISNDGKFGNEIVWAIRVFSSGTKVPRGSEWMLAFP